MQEISAVLLQQNHILAPVIFILLRALTVIVPPLPGILVDIPGIFVFGWFWGFIYGETGVIMGALIAFCIARKFREPIVKKFVPFRRLQEWESKLSDNQKFWALLAIRLPTNPFFDYINYAAGLTGITEGKFLVTALIGNIPSMLPMYYLGGLSISKGIYYGIAFIFALIIVWAVFRKKISNHAASLLTNERQR